MPVRKNAKTNKWDIEVCVNGKRIHRRGFPTKAEASRAEAQLSLDKPKNRMKVVALVDDFLTYKEPRVRESTYYLYRKYNDWFVIPYFEDTYVDKLTYADAEKFADYIRDKGYSANYRTHVLGFVKNALNYGVKFKGLDSNPFSLIERPRAQKKKTIHTWSPEEFSRFYEALTVPRTRAMFLTMYWTGIRKGEARGLQWTDLDLENAVMHVTKQYARLGGLTAPKTESGERDIDLPLSLVRELKNFKEYVSSHEGFKEDWFVFGDMEPISLNSIDWSWRKGIERSGVPKINIHDLRHSHASWLFANGFDTAYISQRMGHSSIATTLQVYTHLMNDVAERERERIRQYDV
jgi:integrase